MADGMLGLYHKLPVSLRTLVASVRGAQLQRRRYGPDTDAMVAEALGRERWSAGQWSAWQAARLGYILDRAATRVPFYREQWAARRRGGDRASWSLLENWPVLEKQSVRADPAAFVADDCDRRAMVHDHTSGTTGTSLSVWLTRDTVRAWYALFEARWRAWYGVSRHDRWAIVGGQLVTPVAQQTPPFWVWNAGMRQLYVSSYHLSPPQIDASLEALVRHRVRYVLGYSSSLHALAQRTLDTGRTDLHLAVAITNAEPLLDYQRTAIETAFHCPVRETYGMGEAVAAASECEAGALHLWPEAGITETFRGGSPVSSGDVGDLVCTGLINADMPLIRYRVGDAGRLASDQSPCGCGRTLPRLAGLEGRIDDILLTKDGRRVGRLDPVFKGGLPVKEAQIIQESLDRLRVLYVPAPDYRPADGATIVDRLRDRMGDVEVVLAEVPAIPRTSTGKFRAVVCALPPAERDAVMASVRGE